MAGRWCAERLLCSSQDGSSSWQLKWNIICGSESDILAMQMDFPDFVGIGRHQRVCLFHQQDSERQV
ncbi:hypothetical protein E2320_014438 [Naja naja]|nr:hypothetical protein E2320_014438 [Naja naja]